MTLKKKRAIWCLSLASIFVPVYYTAASVVISEVAWMGTTKSANDEWIELYNNGAEDVSLTGWQLVWDPTASKPKKVDLTGSIQAGSYFLLERTSDEVLPSVVADQVYVGSLVNSGELMLLKDGTGREVNRLDASAGWPAGDNDTKNTMQLSGSNWITAAATPKSANSSTNTPPATSGNSGSTGGGGDGQGSGSGDDGSGDDTSTGGSGGTNSPPTSLSCHASPSSVSKVTVRDQFTINAGRNRLVTPRTPVLFEARAWFNKNEIFPPSDCRWAFGDGNLVVGMSATHSYLFPGKYNVVLNCRYGTEEAVARTEVQVSEPDVSVVAFEPGLDGGVSVRNDSKNEVNLSGWKIVSNLNSFKFPEDTIVTAKSKVSFPNVVTKIAMGEPTGSIILTFPDGKPASEFRLPAKLVTAASETATTSQSLLESERLAAVRASIRAVENEITNLAATKAPVSGSSVDAPSKKKSAAKSVPPNKSAGVKKPLAGSVPVSSKSSNLSNVDTGAQYQGEELSLGAVPSNAITLSDSPVEIEGESFLDRQFRKFVRMISW